MCLHKEKKRLVMDKKDNATTTTNVGTSGITGGKGYNYSTGPKSYGWICPICGTVNAPWKPTCDCDKNYVYAFQGEPLWPLNKKGQDIDAGIHVTTPPNCPEGATPC